MKSSSFTILLFSFILFTVSWAASDSVQDNFLQCLNQNSLPSNPISGAIYTPNNSSFSSVLQSYIRNLRFTTPTTPKPLLIVTAMHESHVQATVVCAKNVGLQIKIRSGGHDYEGLSYVSDVPFIILDMFNLRSINIDAANGTAWVQAGAILGELYYGIAEKSNVLAFPAGICTGLGAGGHFSGGGYGNMMRKYGLSIDNIIDAQLVDVNGRILNRASMGEDLFWAIRGGGAASFGVILSWTIKLVPVPPTVTVFRVEKTLEQGATDIVHRWQEVVDKLDENLFVRLLLQVANGTQIGAKTVKASFVALYLGQTKELLPLMNQSFPELGLQQNDCIEMSWLESVLYWLDFPTGTSPQAILDRVPKVQSFFKRKSDYLKVPIPKADLESLWKKMIELENVGLNWNPYGGRMSNISESETPFPHRAGNICKIQYAVNWKEQGIEASNHYINLTRELYDFMEPYVSKSPREAFLNYRDIDIGSNSDAKTDYTQAKIYGMKYFNNNFDRLVRVKTAVDPDNFFRNEQSIPPLKS